MGNVRIAGRYAKSLLDLCIEKNQLDATAADMHCLHQAFTDSRELRNLLSSPVVKADAKSDVLEKVFGKSVSPFTMAFIKLLTSKRREQYLGEVAESFNRQLLAHRGIVRSRRTLWRRNPNTIRTLKALRPKYWSSVSDS